MKSLRNRAHHLIDLLPQSDLAQIWVAMETQYYDLYAQRAIDTAKRNFRPGDVLNREEALESLMSDDSTMF
ncbi:hypothetical protein IQ266_09245 [filamentous cyanobacterium LEGE 11480]|uniref:Uncharacterized protein n=1 Tax=Romeriopsis navalis LEGE 11480 TaxID=2777977 RepID=A0A928Z210_9CYAN|nr:hypothetical protein [Romeriopsis navalis]MBE9029911.1 hypothetical protein [Romeriopsis navalis LEGE 11480]